MTLCIAAKTQLSMLPSNTVAVINADPAIVLCTDLQGSTTSSSAETVNKIEGLPWGFVALLAGTINVARQISNIFRRCMEKAVPSEDTQKHLRILQRGLGIYKRQFAESHIQSRLGMHYGEFRTKGKANLPEDLYRELCWDIHNHQSQTEMLIAGFVEVSTANIGVDGFLDSPVIYKVSGDQIQVCEHFAVIGSGTEIGEASLYYREHSTANTLDQTLYHVYEAKRLGEKAPEVGRKTALSVLRPPINGQAQIEIIRQSGLAILESQFKNFGPQPIKELQPIPAKDRCKLKAQSFHKVTTT